MENKQELCIAICEDDPQDMSNITALCRHFAEEHAMQLTIIEYENATELLESDDEFDAVLFDIVMNGRPEGVSAARKLRHKDFSGAIVFTTSSRDYYPEGFEVEAAHYLIKPVKYEAFEEAMLRAFRGVFTTPRKIEIPQAGGNITLATSRILYGEVQNRVTLLHLDIETLRVPLTLNQLEELLGEDPFLRCFRSYIVNMAHIEKMGEEHFILKNGEKVPISIRNRRMLKERYLDYRLKEA